MACFFVFGFLSLGSRPQAWKDTLTTSAAAHAEMGRMTFEAAEATRNADLAEEHARSAQVSRMDSKTAEH